MYFYHWHGGKDLHVHSGKFVQGSGGELIFETNDGSNKRYLHCDYDHTYSRNEVILSNRDDLKAIEKLINNYESVTKYYKNSVTVSMTNSLNNLKALRNKLMQKQETEEEPAACDFCFPNMDDRYALFDFDINFGVFGTGAVSTYIDEKNFLATTVTGTESKDLGWIKKRIKFCPMCGRKLN